MLPLKGINTDTDKAKLSGEFALDVLNGVVYKGNIQNEEGFIVHSTYLVDNNLQPLGILPINEGKKVFVCKGPTDDHILILDKDGNFESKLVTDLGLNMDYPVDIEAQYNHKMELVIAITDGLNTPKVINLDNLPNPFNINSIEMFPVFKEPVIDVDLVEGAGNLLSGVVQIFIRYVDYDGTVTASSSITNPISIASSSERYFENFQGNPAGDLTDKGLRVTISNVDLNFEKIQIGILEKQDGVISTKIVTELNTAESIVFLVTGNETFSDLPFEEAIAPLVKYKTIKHLTQVDGTLYGASVTEEEIDNLQKYLLNTNLSWVSEIRDFTKMEESYKVHENIFYNRTFAHGEVYAFYIRLKIKDKGWTKAFHIPGRKVRNIANNPARPLENELLSTIRDTNLPFFNSFDLGRDINLDEENIKWFHTRDTSFVTSNSPDRIEGEFGYWENLDEPYPNIEDFQDLIEGGVIPNVRHHKFPSYNAMYQRYNAYPQNADYGITKRDILGVKVDIPFSDFPPEIANQIEGYELLYAERNQANTTSLGDATALKFVKTFGGQGTHEPNYSYVEDYFKLDNNFAGANIRINSTRTDVNPDVYMDFIPEAGGKRFRFYNPDLLYSKQGSLPNYIETHYILQKHIGDDNWLQGPFYLGRDVEEGDPTLTKYGFDSTLLNPAQSTKWPINFGVYPIKEIEYVPQHVVYKDINNTHSEEFIHIELLDEVSQYIIDYEKDMALFVSLKAYKHNIAFKFETQKLVSTGRTFDVNSSGMVVYGGDVFNAHYSYITHSNYLVSGNWRDDELPLLPPRTVFRFIRTFLGQFKMNLNFRYEVNGDASTYFYPVTKLTYPKGEFPQAFRSQLWFLLYKPDTVYNKIMYNKDYSSVNNVHSIEAYNYSQEEHFVYEDNHKIIRSNIRSPEERTPSWRRFGANDYYIIPRNKGIITNIKGAGNALFINTENSLFISAANEELNVQGTSAVLGSGDIFGHSFKELVADELGYAGTQHKYSCLLTPLGYFFADIEKKRIFISDGSTVKDINNGNNIFFENNLTEELDNPFINQGYTVAWDDKYSRIIFTKISGETFTRSYYPGLEAWFSRHSYFPTYIYNDRRDLYSLQDNIIYKHNEENYGQFYNGDIYPFHIVSMFNSGLQIDKLLTNMSWNTEVYLGDEYLKGSTFHEVLLWNRHQSSGEIELVPFDSSKTMLENYRVANIRRKKSVWNFNNFRNVVINDRLPFIEDFNSINSNIDKTKPFYERGRLIDTFFVYKLLFNNEKMINLQSELESPRIEVLDIVHQENIVTR